MRRWTLLLAGAALWLFLAAIPALADGGPHVSAANSGSTTLKADSCAGCHRAHTAQGAMLLAASSEEALCLSCHGTAGTGATTNVEDGIQYTVGTTQVRGGPVLGALRGGGFVNARIKSSDPYRLAYTAGTSVRQLTKVSVLSGGQAVTSAHMKLTGAAGVTLQGKAWGNGAISATANAGPTVSLSCASCHNPHGNNKYRILNPIPAPVGLTVATAAADVTDALPLPADGDARNYTVIQTDTAGTTRFLLASQVASSTIASTAGDYFHRRVPWNSTDSTSAAWDAPNGDTTNFNPQINAWCSSCHTRYNAGSGSYETDSGDAIFKYRHTTTSNKPCTTCHVSHGSNAAMPGAYSSVFPYPGGTPTGASSRLLKIDNRGTCQACHDPTGTITAGQSFGTLPVPTVP